jgi:glycosyltransferase involved in cell wall biosynthesis
MSDSAENVSEHSDRLWIVSELYFPEETSTGYYMTRVAEGLADDFDVHAVSGYPNYLYRNTSAASFEIRNKVSIHRLKSTRLDKNSIPKKALNMLTFGLAVFFFGISNFKRGDNVLVVTTPPTLPFFVSIISLFKGLKMTLLVHDTYPEILAASGKLKRDSFFFGLLQSIKNWIYKMSAGIIVVGRDMERLARRQTVGLETRIVTIPNWAELETVAPDEALGEKFKLSLGLTGKFVVIYAGNMGYPNDIETIVDAADMLRDESQIHFVFLGTGAKLKWLRNRIEKLQLNNVTLLDPRPREEQREFLNGCDIGIVSLVVDMKGVSVPSRTYNLLAAGKPILGLVDAESEVGELIREEGVGFLASHGRPAELSEAIRKISRIPTELSKMGVAARKLAVERFNRDVAIKAYRQFLL